MKLLVENITKIINKKSILSKISLDLTPGLYGLIGKNGAGKTTLFNIIVDLLDPTEGQVTYNGIAINKLDQDYRSILGYLPQHFGYNPQLTVFEYLQYIATLKGIDNNAIPDKIKQILDTVHLREQIDIKLKKLSGGMIQRVGIAQSILNDPKILILDEPTVGLDPMERVKFRQIFSDLSTERIVLISSHIISDIATIAEKVIFIHKGEIIEKGIIDEILKNIETNVWEVSIPIEKLDDFRSNSTIVNQSYQNDKVYIRYLSDQMIEGESKLSDITLEDAFICSIKDFEEGEQQ